MTTETEPMVWVLHMKCENCGRIADRVLAELVDDIVVRQRAYPFITTPTEARVLAEIPKTCDPDQGGCGDDSQFLIATEPVR